MDELDEELLDLAFWDDFATAEGLHIVKSPPEPGPVQLVHLGQFRLRGWLGGVRLPFRRGRLNPDNFGWNNNSFHQATVEESDFL